MRCLVSWPCSQDGAVAVVTDRLALAVRPSTARRVSPCAVCTVPIAIGASMVRLVNPAGWCHESCVWVLAGKVRQVTITDGN